MPTVPIVPNLTNLAVSPNQGRLSVKDFPIYKKKVVVSNLPKNACEDEILTFFNTYINTLRSLTQVEETIEGQEKDEDDEEDEPQITYSSAIIDNIQVFEGIMRYGVIQINNKDDIEH